MRTLALFLWLSLSTTLFANNFPQSPWVTRHGMTSNSYQAEFDKWTSRDFRLTYVSGHQATYRGRTSARYNAIWVKEPGPSWYARHGLTAREYQREVNNASQKHYQPIVVDAFNVGNQILFAVIFEKASSRWVARHGMTSDEYQSEFNQRIKQGYRLRYVTGYEFKGKARYAAIFDKSPSPSWVARHGMSSAKYRREFKTLARKGYAPVVIDGFYVNGVERFAAIWHKADSPFIARHQLKGGAAYQLVADDFYYEGYRPVAIDGYGDGTEVQYATSWKNTSWSSSELNKLNNMVEQFRIDNNIPSLSLAIVENERLRYAKAFGLADREANESATTSHRYRIASLSKALTAAAVSKLIDETTLSLNDQVFGTNGILSSYALDNNLADSDMKRITVADLLEHAEGGWGASCQAGTNDEPIMFRNNSQTRDWIITNTLTNIPLPGIPGSRFCYSNFGYAALEAVIEASNGGVDYEDYILQTFADAAGANSLAIAGNTLADRAANEVKYYDFFNPYIWNVSRMAGHGGWMVTPVDYLRILTRLDGGTYRHDLFSANAYNIFTGNDVVLANDAWNIGNGYYAKGLVRNNSQSRFDHNGNITGTLAEYLNYDDGFSIMLVINMRQPPDGNASSPRPNLKGLAVDIHDATIQYPNYDLF
jgi:CubicO group peptidase (beta-lactamase class C family)